MKFFSLLAAALLPTGLLAAPVADDNLIAIETEAHAAAEARAIVKTRDAADVSLNEPAFSLGKREIQVCEIVGSSSSVNCRAGPNTSSSIVRKLSKGNTYAFSCVTSGECVVIGGATNCGWDYSYSLACYVNGHYTDGKCTQARLGWC
ncbi:hypothetical protein QBC40DRAFT_316403 [Triangularia verruculosa]|uniref:Uncharacterized protein n=1 Tax=Triangularia verruculosa TaxID=2587418 RepID=A0AAN6XMP0_9PEZI|nr:hypothetical protein QBC40DRAFT_316403 [Triangularia verruculosa]